MAYYENYDALIVKLMPGIPHENSYSEIVKLFDRKTAIMEIDSSELHWLGSSKFAGRNSSNKGDAAFAPRGRGKPSVPGQPSYLSAACLRLGDG